MTTKAKIKKNMKKEKAAKLEKCLKKCFFHIFSHFKKFIFEIHFFHIFNSNYYSPSVARLAISRLIQMQSPAIPMTLSLITSFLL